MKHFRRSISRLYTGIDTVWQMHDGNTLQTSGRSHERFWFCLVQVSTTRFSLFAAFPPVFMATDCAFEDAMHISLPGSPPLSSNVGSPGGSGHDLDGMASRSTDEQLTEIRDYYYHSYTLWSFSHPGSPTLKKSSTPFLPRWPHLQKWNRITTPSLHACARSTEMWSQPQASQVLQHLGTSLVKTMAPQPQGPVAQDHLMTTGTQDEDLIHSPAPKMNNPVVPFFYDSLANNTTKGLQSASIILGKNPICQRATNLSEFIAKQVPCQSGLFLKHEPNVKTLLLDIRYPSCN